MSQHGRVAQGYWRKFRAGGRIAEIDVSETLFTDLDGGVQERVRIRWTAESLAAPAAVGECYQGHASGLRQQCSVSDVEACHGVIRGDSPVAGPAPSLLLPAAKSATIKRPFLLEAQGFSYRTSTTNGLRS